MFTTAKGRNKRQSRHERINSVVHLHVENHMAMKRNKGDTHTTMWMDLEDTVLSDRSQSAKDK